MERRYGSSSRRLGHAMGFLAVTAFLLFGWISFQRLIDERAHPNRNLLVKPGATQLVLKRDQAGHYRFPGRINGQPVDFLVDTGATRVSVPAHLSARLKLVAGVQGIALTANGPVHVHETRINALAFGPFQLTQVRGHLNPGQKEDEILLGMSALKHFDFYQKGDVLVIGQPTTAR